MPYPMSLTECMLEQSTMVGQVKRGFGEHFSVNVDGESEICEENFSSVYSTYTLGGSNSVTMLYFPLSIPRRINSVTTLSTAQIYIEGSK